MNSPIPIEPPVAVSARERWRAIIDEQRDSGLSVKTFCQQRGLAASSLFAWRRKLSIPGHGRFAEVKLANPSAAMPPAARRGPENSIEICLDGNRRLLVRAGFDHDLLIELIRVLEGMPSMLEATPSNMEGAA